jgi:hypothetical protein
MSNFSSFDFEVVIKFYLSKNKFAKLETKNFIRVLLFCTDQELKDQFFLISERLTNHLEPDNQ